ncbi:hypothetical protein HPB50_014570 [Hyalomma asiaticum]|uniref:Uncharacterized protein n=1 Tax=Hyalomma asiaticum TaxID=266040 RepID=A0ACB7S992_HYAAI|nr:hypothetical protein HPB50_014570 [Hyalomma asiaticum]
MIRRLHPPLRPFKPGQRGHLAWLDAVLEINGITDEPTKHALLSTLPADLQYLAAASSASPRPYNALRAAVLAYNGEPYRPPYSEYFASAATKRPVVPSPRPTHASDPPPKPVTTSGTSRPPSSSPLSESTFDVEVERVDCSIVPSTESSSASETSPPAVISRSDVPRTYPNFFDGLRQHRHHRHFASCQAARSEARHEHRVACCSRDVTVFVTRFTRRQSHHNRPRAHFNLLPDFRDAAASTNTPTDTADGLLVETPSHSPPSTQPDDQPAALHKPVALVTPSGSVIAEAPALLPTETLASSLPPEASDTGNATLPAPADVTTPMEPDRAIASIPRAQFRRRHKSSRRRTDARLSEVSTKTFPRAQAFRRHISTGQLPELREHTTVLRTSTSAVVGVAPNTMFAPPPSTRKSLSSLSIAVATPSTPQALSAAPLSSVSRAHRFITPVQVQPAGLGFLSSTLRFEPTMWILLPRSSWPGTASSG